MSLRMSLCHFCQFLTDMFIFVNGQTLKQMNWVRSLVQISRTASLRKKINYSIATQFHHRVTKLGRIVRTEPTRLRSISRAKLWVVRDSNPRPGD